ncbi:MAG: hypothetical protein ACE5HB_04045 [Terriglobia bacterium]
MRPIQVFALFTCCLACCVVWTPPANAHRLEPISTEFALPFRPRAGVFEVTYEFEREGRGRNEQALPEAELELGVFRRLQINLGMPLLRLKEDPGEPANWTGGRFEVGARYLLFGSPVRPYAVSLQGSVEAPTGSSELVGDATEVGAALHVDRYLGERVRVHSNLGWSSTVGGSERPERVFRYNNALVWMASLRWNPVLEILGATETRTGETELAVQPEMIFWANRHLELKVGVPVGLTSSTPDIGVRAQIAITWGTE